MKFILYCLLVIYGIVIIDNLIATIYLSNWFKKEKEKKYKTDFKNQLIYLIIPMLNEQKVVRQTFKNFKNIVLKIPNVKVMFVTTSKEKKVEEIETTFDILNRLIVNEKNIYLCNYDKTNGVMAHQINYAISIIKQIEKNNKIDKITIGIYNADSNIDENTIKYVLEQNEIYGNNKVCFQQYSWFCLNGIKKQIGIIPSASLFQTRWSLLFEIWRLHKQLFIFKIYSKLSKKGIKGKINNFLYLIFEKMNYVVGHGFFMDINLIEEIGGFPEKTINEDAFLGYIIDNKNIKIQPIPYLEKADFAPNIPIYIKQQTTWVNGPIYAFQYYKMYKASNKLNIKENFRAGILAIKLFMHFIYWILSPYLLLVFMPILLYRYLNILGIIISIFYILMELPIIHYLIRKLVLRIKEKSIDKDIAKPSVWCIPFFIIHSFGAIRNIYMQILGKNNIENKYKTERE